MSYKDKIKEVYTMMSQGQMLEAFDKYYAENVVMHEPNKEPRKGKALNRKFEEEWMSNIQEWHGGGPKTIASDETNGVTMVESWMDITFKDGNRMKMEEVAVQKWEGDEIVDERFYYNAPGQN